MQFDQGWNSIPTQLAGLCPPARGALFPQPCFHVEQNGSSCARPPARRREVPRHFLWKHSNFLLNQVSLNSSFPSMFSFIGLRRPRGPFHRHYPELEDSSGRNLFYILFLIMRHNNCLKSDTGYFTHMFLFLTKITHGVILALLTKNRGISKLHNLPRGRVMVTGMK